MVKLSVQLVKPKNLLNQLKTASSLEDYVIESLKGIDLVSNKLNPDLILYVCKIVENAFCEIRKSMTYDKIKKKEIVMQLLKKLLPSISVADELIISQIIEHLHSSGRIKTIGFFKWMYAKLKGSKKEQKE
jgi:translation initiation factor 2B subunit (eIF-2B alpha/beta/delta family)